MRKIHQAHRKLPQADRPPEEDHEMTQRQETSVDKNLTTRSASTLAVLFTAVMLAACGGGGEPPAAGSPSPAPAPAPAPGPAPSPSPSDLPFATPASTTATTETGGIETYQYAENAGAQTPGTPAFAGGAVSYSAALGSAQAYAGTAVRFHAPNNTAVNASAYGRLKIQLRSGTDALLLVKLQPTPVAGDGCTATAEAMVSATLTELVIDLNTTSFPLPAHCATGTTVSAVRAGLFAVDVINAASTAGNHDLSVGSISLAP